MKKLGKNVGKLIIKYVGAKGIAAGAVSLLLVTGGFHILWEDYQNGNLFKPELFVKNRELQGNQIMFPEKENIQDDSKDPQENDNKKLERDPDANDPYGQEKENDHSFEISQDQIQADPENAGTLFTDPSQAFAGSTGDSSWPGDGRNAVLSPDAEEKVNIPAGMTNVSEENGQGTNTSAGQNSVSGSEGRDTTAGGGSGGTGNGSGSSVQEPGTLPGGNDAPAPDQPNTPDTPSDDSGKIVDPDFPDDSKRPDLPKDPTWGGGSAASIYDGVFPDEGYEKGSIEAESAKLILSDVSDYTSEVNVDLYKGAYISDWKLLHMIYAVVHTDTGVYRIRNYSENFKVGAHPDIADDDFTVTFYFRPNSDSEWQKVEHTFSVKYCRVIVMGAADEKGNRRTLDSVYLKEGQNIDLLTELTKLYDKQKGEWGVGSFERLDKIVPGWSVNGTQNVYTSTYTPTEPGRYEMYPLEREEVPEKLTVYLESDYIVYRQVLSGYYGSEEDILEVPQGIQQVRIWGTTIKTIKIPESVDTLLDDFIMVTDSYEVSEANPYFCSENGMIYNKEKTELLGIPIAVKNVTVPETVEKVVLPYDSNLEQISFLSETPPSVDLSRISGVQITVPSDSYADYMISWRNSLGNNSLVTAENKDYKYVNGAVLSENNTVLNRISDENSSLWIVPEQVERVKSHAADNCAGIERMIMPEKIRFLESESLNGEGLREIYFPGSVPPEIQKNTFGDLSTKNLVIYVSEDSRNAYIEKWGEVLGNKEIAEKLVQARDCEMIEEDGASYLNISGSAVLIQAPEEFSSFEDLKLPSGVNEITEIGTNAFDNCTVPEVLVLPDSVTTIGRNAFLKCKGLEGILSEATEPVYIGKAAFGDIRFIAFNTSSLALEDESIVRSINTYARTGCEIPASGLMYILGCGEKLVMGEGDTKDLLFGLDGDDTYLLNSTSGFTGELRGLSDHPITYIIRNAMAGCGDITIPDDVAENIKAVQTNAFRDSGLHGTIKFSEKLMDIGSGAFSGCNSLEGIEFAGSISSESNTKLSIGQYAFQGTGLTEIVFPENLKNLDYEAFTDTPVTSITFTGSTVPMLSYMDPGAAYYFGSDENITLHLAGEAEGQEGKYIAAWKYALQGYEKEDDINRDSVYWSVLSDAMSEWMDITFEFPMDDITWEYYPEFTEYVDACVPYYIENVKITGEQRAYAYFGMPAPEYPDREEKPNIQDYIDEWKQRLEEEKEADAQKKEELLDPVKPPQEEEKKSEQEEVVEDPSEKKDEETPEDPDEDVKDPETDEVPDDPGENGSDNTDTPDAPDDPGNGGSDTGDKDGDNTGGETGEGKDENDSNHDSKDDSDDNAGNSDTGNSDADGDSGDAGEDDDRENDKEGSDETGSSETSESGSTEETDTAD